MASTAKKNAPEEVVIVVVKEVILVATEAKVDEPNAAKKAKPPKEKKPKDPRGSKTSSTHPPFFQMIKEAISSLKKKGGSSPRAITKYMEDKNKADLPPNYKKMLGMHIKKLVLDDKLTKVKDSFKLAEGLKKVPANKPVKKAIKNKTASKPKTAPKSAKPTLKMKAAKKVAKAPAASNTIVSKLTKDAKSVALAKKPAPMKVAPTKKPTTAKLVSAKNPKSIKFVKSPAKENPATKAPVAKKA